MSNVRKPGGMKPPRRKKFRPTIGLLIGRLGDIGYAARVWPGVAAVAEERDVNLICFVGGALNALHEFDAQRNVIYDLVSPENVDGLVAMSGSIGQFIGPDRLIRFYERFRPLPIVSIAMELEGIPSILVDNSAGMRDAITHLIEVHGFRRIAFLRGPETNLEAEQRYYTYLDVLAKHDLAFDPDLIASGNYLSPAGEEAVRLFLDQRKVRFEAIASANDEMVLGALAALRGRGLRVPEDVGIVGFDNLEEAQFAAPPLTTIRQPLDEQGRRATEMLLDLMAGKKVPLRVTLPTELVVRLSCGCFPQRLVPIAAGKETPAGGKAKSPLAASRKRILAELKEAATSTAGLDPEWAEGLLAALTTSMKNRKAQSVFLRKWDEILRRVGAGGGDVMQWQRVLSILHHRALPSLAGGDLPAWDVSMRQAQSLIGEVAQWAQVHRRMQSERLAFDFSTRISEPLMTAFDVASLTNVVAEQMPKLGIRSCYLSLYDRPVGGKPVTPTEWSKLILAYNEKGRVNLEQGGRRFPSRQLVPRDILPSKKRYAIMLEPLHFRDETQLGFILFEPLQTQAGSLREALSRQISTALKGAVLLQERRRAEETLRASEQMGRQFQESLRTLVEVSNELSRAESMDALCRRAVELGRARLGFDRIGIWFRGAEPGSVVGSYGIDESGNLTDERGLCLPAGARQAEILGPGRPSSLRFDNVDLYNGPRNVVGCGTQVVAAMWDGEQTIGLVAADNLLQHRPVTDHDFELLNLFASTLGNLCSRKQAEDSLRASEQEERHFQERLRTLLEIGNDLSRAESMDSLCRQAVELGRARFGFDRLGIWFHSPDPGFIDGSYGTDENGQTTDERTIHLATEGHQMEILQQTRPIALLRSDVELRDGQGNVVGRGAQAQAAIWDGERVIGFISMDNLLHFRPITDQDCELLNLYASSLGYLCSRKRAEDALKEYSGHLEEMVEERTRELQEAQENLVHREKLAVLGQLAATVSHELRNPLATIRVSASALDLKVRDKGLGVERSLDRIQRKITRCDNIISELLDYARLPGLNLQAVDFDDWLNRLLDEQVLPEGIVLRRDLASRVHMSLDPERFRRVIINLVDNARQAMLAAPGADQEVKVLGVQTKVEGDRLKVVISDTGTGIAPEIMPHIFEPLYSTKGFGAGLGLSVVKGIVDQHGGEIEITSEAGQGARVVVRLPLTPLEG